jgi:hypothetical protein
MNLGAKAKPRILKWEDVWADSITGTDHFVRECGTA